MTIVFGSCYDFRDIHESSSLTKSTNRNYWECFLEARSSQFFRLKCHEIQILNISVMSLTMVILQYEMKFTKYTPIYLSLYYCFDFLLDGYLNIKQHHDNNLNKVYSISVKENWIKIKIDPKEILWSFIIIICIYNNVF